MLFYKIPSNSGTFEIGNFFLVIFFSAYLYGFYIFLKKFHVKRFRSLLKIQIYNQKLILKKNLFFKRYLLMNKLSI